MQDVDPIDFRRGHLSNGPAPSLFPDLPCEGFPSLAGNLLRIVESRQVDPRGQDDGGRHHGARKGTHPNLVDARDRSRSLGLDATAELEKSVDAGSLREDTGPKAFATQDELSCSRPRIASQLVLLLGERSEIAAVTDLANATAQKSERSAIGHSSPGSRARSDTRRPSFRSRSRTRLSNPGRRDKAAVVRCQAHSSRWG